jgi:predicted transcriptional regulator
MKKRVVVGGSLEEAAARVAEAWKGAAQGRASAGSDTTTFVSWSALASVMTDKRHELLRHLHKSPAPSIRALARDLGRDFKRVHEDVASLERAGLIERRDGALHADYSEIQAAILLEA